MLVVVVWSSPKLKTCAICSLGNVQPVCQRTLSLSLFFQHSLSVLFGVVRKRVNRTTFNIVSSVRAEQSRQTVRFGSIALRFRFVLISFWVCFCVVAERASEFRCLRIWPCEGPSILRYAAAPPDPLPPLCRHTSAVLSTV